jgi:hypothetical protein
MSARKCSTNGTIALISFHLLMPITIHWSDWRARSLVCDRIETVGQIVPRAIDPSQNMGRLRRQRRSIRLIARPCQ